MTPLVIGIGICLYIRYRRDHLQRSSTESDKNHIEFDHEEGVNVECIEPHHVEHVEMSGKDEKLKLKEFIREQVI